MAFIWNPEPNLPPIVPPIVIGPEETSSKVHVVANTVNVGGAVSYNTTNVGYDVVYEFDSLNVRNMRVLTGVIDRANIGTAVINTATINQATINTANITHATINIGFFTGNATANFSMVSKQYVDNAIAGISSGSGPDTTANLITTKGDLLVGFAPNTAHRLGVGANGQVLSVLGSSNLKQQWISTADSQEFTGLYIGTHHHPTLKRSQVLLRHADTITMDDGEVVSGWDNVTADITVSGPGGLDANSVEAANTWYEVWAIRNSTSGAKALLLHRMLDRVLDQQWPATLSLVSSLRNGNPALTAVFQRYSSRVSQSFVPAITGGLKSVELTMSRTLTPGGNIWVSIQPENGLGNASGSILATSRPIGADFITTSSSKLRFTFDTPTIVNSGDRYHMVVEGDWPIVAAGNCINLFGNTAPLGPGQQSWMANVGYTSGNLTINSGYGDSRMFNVVTSTWATSPNVSGPQDLYFKIFIEENSTALALPAGYNQKALLSYVHNNQSSNFKEYSQHNRMMVMGFEDDWLAWNSGATNETTAVELGNNIPPIACSVQFLCWTFNLSLGFAFGFALGDRYMIDLSLNSIADYDHRGAFRYGPNQGKMGLSPVVTLDDSQFMMSRQVGVDFRLYVANISF